EREAEEKKRRSSEPFAHLADGLVEGAAGGTRGCPAGSGAKRRKWLVDPALPSEPPRFAKLWVRGRWPRPRVALPEADRLMPLRLATLNVWGLPEPFSRKPDERLEAIAGRLAGLEVDAIALQEVWTPSARERLARAGRDAGMEHIWHKHAILRGGRVGGSGLLVLSRRPIESACFERYAIAGLPERVTEADYFGGKGFVRLGLATPDGPVELVDTHLQARYPSHSPSCYASHRTGQVVQLALGLRDGPHPVIALGDFTCGDGDPVYDVLLGLTGLRDVAVVLDRPEPTLLRSNPYASETRRTDQRIDLALARDGWDRRVVPRSVRRIF